MLIISKWIIEKMLLGKKWRKKGGGNYGSSGPVVLRTYISIPSLHLAFIQVALINKRNVNGPKLLPCGTPNVSTNIGELVSGHDIRICLVNNVFG